MHQSDWIYWNAACSRSKACTGLSGIASASSRASWTTTTARYRKAGGTLFIELVASEPSSATSCTKQQSFAELPPPQCSSLSAESSWSYHINLHASFQHVQTSSHDNADCCFALSETESQAHTRCQACKHTSSRPTRKGNNTFTSSGGTATQKRSCQNWR